MFTPLVWMKTSFSAAVRLAHVLQTLCKWFDGRGVGGFATEASTAYVCLLGLLLLSSPLFSAPLFSSTPFCTLRLMRKDMSMFFSKCGCVRTLAFCTSPNHPLSYTERSLSEMVGEKIHVFYFLRLSSPLFSWTCMIFIPLLLGIKIETLIKAFNETVTSAQLVHEGLHVSTRPGAFESEVHPGNVFERPKLKTTLQKKNLFCLCLSLSLENSHAQIQVRLSPALLYFV